MSISFRKINSMIEAEVSAKELSVENERLLVSLCTKIYLIESSVEKGGSQQIISDIKGEVSLRADEFQEEV